MRPTLPSPPTGAMWRALQQRLASTSTRIRESFPSRKSSPLCLSRKTLSAGAPRPKIPTSLPLRQGCRKSMQGSTIFMCACRLQKPPSGSTRQGICPSRPCILQASFCKADFPGRSAQPSIFPCRSFWKRGFPPLPRVSYPLGAAMLQHFSCTGQAATFWPLPDPRPSSMRQLPVRSISPLPEDPQAPRSSPSSTPWPWNRALYTPKRFCSICRATLRAMSLKTSTAAFRGPCRQTQP